MALIGTISGSVDATGALTSNNVISGTLVISNALVAPAIPSDAIILVSPSAGSGLKSVFGGDIRVSGSAILDSDIAVNGGDITSTAGTFNFVSTAGVVNVGGATTTSSFTGDIGVSGRTNVATVVERLVNSNGGTGTVAFDLSSQGIFYVNNPAGNITANFTGVPVTNNRVLTPTIILSQSATARIVNAVQIDTVAQTINWANNVVPTGNSNKQDVFGFSLIRSGSAWKVLGQMSTFG